jgi:hypothetical protein
VQFKTAFEDAQRSNASLTAQTAPKTEEAKPAESSAPTPAVAVEPAEAPAPVTTPAAPAADDTQATPAEGKEDKEEN